MSSTSVYHLFSLKKTGSVTLVIEYSSIGIFNDFKSIDFTINDYPFVFGLYPKRELSRCDRENVFVYLNVDSCDALIVHYKVSILGGENEQLFTSEYDWTFDDKRGFHMAKFMKRCQLLESSNNYLFNRKLTLLCEVELIGLGQNNPQTVQDLTTLSDNLQLLLTDGKLSDATLLVGTKEMRVHKTILSARSPVFAAMFDCEEKRLAKVLTITDMDVDVCQELILYIYTGKVDKMARYAMELLEAADKYQLDSLKNICEHHLCSTLSIESAANVLILADQHRATNLKTNCIEFISTNVEHVQSTDGWKVLETNAKLLRELFMYSARK